MSNYDDDERLPDGRVGLYDDDERLLDGCVGLAGYDGSVWHVLADTPEQRVRVAVCGKRVPRVAPHRYAREQHRIGAGDRCTACRWREPPSFLKALSDSERMYLDCVTEVDLANGKKLRSDHFNDRLRAASEEWGWGPDSAANRRTLAHRLMHVAESIGDGSDEIVEARRRLRESRERRREIVKILNAKVEEDADTLSMLEQQLRVAISRGGRRS